MTKTMKLVTKVKFYWHSVVHKIFMGRMLPYLYISFRHVRCFEKDQRFPLPNFLNDRSLTAMPTWVSATCTGIEHFFHGTILLWTHDHKSIANTPLPPITLCKLKAEHRRCVKLYIFGILMVRRTIWHFFQRNWSMFQFLIHAKPLRSMAAFLEMPQYLAYLKNIAYCFIKLSAKSHSFNILCTMNVLSCPTMTQGKGIIV